MSETRFKEARYTAAMVRGPALPQGCSTLSCEDFLVARRPLIATVFRLGYLNPPGSTR
ncbi:hypothetical protein [Serpentinimonas maccroryi]|jgi:hypothetical protein|uniref:hypothetical protein n=1 Tax=Serpentinimonas maccroryi TaxID=1458426 RepID=UPI0020348D0E|nr:hypothetical protein [Serpentinimonas maccroryi]MCM2478915.1 hypothetical protein [Serpentinimonas maccroryi]